MNTPLSQYALVDAIIAVNPLITMPETAREFAGKAPHFLQDAYHAAATGEQQKAAAQSIATWIRARLTAVPFGLNTDAQRR